MSMYGFHPPSNQTPKDNIFSAIFDALLAIAVLFIVFWMLVTLVKDDSQKSNIPITTKKDN